MNHITRHFWLFFKEVRCLIESPFFLMLTIVGNSFIFLCGLLFWFLEHEPNPKVDRYMDAIWWAFATATTTGYGDITPVTDAGKVLSILLMLVGLALFSMYTALFAETIISTRSLSSDVQSGNKDRDQYFK
jgi:voltage-gated potassium channel